MRSMRSLFGCFALFNGEPNWFPLGTCAAADPMSVFRVSIGWDVLRESSDFVADRKLPQSPLPNPRIIHSRFKKQSIFAISKQIRSTINLEILDYDHKIGDTIS